MEHDFDDKHKGKDCDNANHIMSYSDLPIMVKWSSCSKADFQAHYLFITKQNGWKWCMEGRLVNSILAEKKIVFSCYFYVGSHMYTMSIYINRLLH